MLCIWNTTESVLLADNETALPDPDLRTAWLLADMTNYYCLYSIK